MATNLTGETIKDTYTQLLHIDGGPAASEKSVLSGNGIVTALKMGTSSATVEGDLVVNGSLSASGGIQLTTTLPIGQGGTGAETVSGARSNLGLGSMALVNSPVPVANGGTGATDASTARSNLGLGNMAVQPSNDVDIIGGSIDGVDITGGSVDAEVLTNQTYGAFSSTSDQTTAADTPEVVDFNNTSASEGVSIESATDITFSVGGVYLTDCKLQFQNTDSEDHRVFVWQQLNDVDVDGTGLSIVVPKSSDGGLAIATAVCITSVSESDVIKIIWATDSNLVSLHHDAAQTSPYNRPEIPSVTFNAIKIAQEPNS